jgi:hypothetical protein
MNRAAAGGSADQPGRKPSEMPTEIDFSPHTNSVTPSGTDAIAKGKAGDLRFKMLQRYDTCDIDKIGDMTQNG